MSDSPFQIGSKVRWGHIGKARILDGSWNERGVWDYNEFAEQEAEAVHVIVDIVEDHTGEPFDLVLDIGDDHPFFKDPAVSPMYLEPLSPLELLAEAADDGTSE